MPSTDNRSRPAMLTTAPKRTAAHVAALVAVASAVIPSLAAAQAPAQVTCRTTAVATTHGGPVPGLTQLAPVIDGKVTALNGNTGGRRMIRFTNRSGRRLIGVDGARYAIAGQTLTSGGRPGGAYLIAARLGADHRVACAGPSGMRVLSDAAGRSSSGTDLPLSAVLEVSGSSRNQAQLLQNDTPQRVCTNTPVHPDGARPDTTNSHPTANVWCYKGAGAWLNDIYGVERRSPLDPYYGAYFADNAHTHRIVYNGVVVPAAKRPSTKPDGEAIPNSAIAWRPYSSNFHNPPGL